MKKNDFNLINLFALSILTLISCSSEKNDAEVRLTALSGMERIGQSEPLFGEPEAKIKAAKNEYESFQVVVGALQKNIQVVSAEMSDLTSEVGTIGKENIVLYRPEYVRVGRSSPGAQLPPGLYTDPLVPFINPQTGEPVKPWRTYTEYWLGPTKTEGYEMYALPFDVWKGQNQPIWVDVYIPKNTAAGEYKGTFTVTMDNFRNSRGESDDTLINKIVSIPIKLTVWNFALPDGPTLRNNFGGLEDIEVRFNVERDSEKYREIEMRYCQMFADHRLNPPVPARFMPVMNDDGSLHIIPERHNELKKFIENFHVTDFQIPCAPLPGVNNPYKELPATDKSKLVKYYRDFYSYVKENGWDKRAYINLYDEPNTAGCYKRVLELGALVREASPQLKILVVEQPYNQDPSWQNIDAAVDIWCPLFGFIDRDAVNAALAHGDEVWSYTALAQSAPEYHPNYDKVKDYDPPYWHIDAPLTSYRTPTWMNYQYGISGLLYWSLTTGVKDDWHYPSFRVVFNGEGYCIYPGTPCGIDGPISSIRLKSIRESMEDYEYLHLYEELAGREAVMKIISKVAPNWWDTSKDPKVIFSAREMLAEEIMKLKK